MDKGKPKQVWLPESLKDVKDGLDIGLYYLSIGREAKTIPDDHRKNIRIYLSESTNILLSKLVPSKYKTDSEAILNALSWVDNQPNHLKKAKLTLV